MDFPAKPGSAEEPWTEEAFRGFFLEHYERVTGVLHRLVGDASRAEELANEAFWKLYRRRITSSPDGNLRGWLYRTATNLGIDALRSEARRRRYEQAAAQSATVSGAAADPLNELLRQETRIRVRAALAAIPPAQAQLLILRASGFTYKEVSEILKLKAGSVGTMLIRAEAKFRKRYVNLTPQFRTRT
ncbi:MAG: sigma-70 family RNA polymerase sigma factor [Terriglobia bacterium]